MNNKLIKRNLVNEHRFYWLRSVDSVYPMYVGFVYDNGGTGDSVADDYFGYSPICLII